MPAGSRRGIDGAASGDAAPGQGCIHEGGHGLTVGDVTASEHGEHLTPRHPPHLADALDLLLGTVEPKFRMWCERAIVDKMLAPRVAYGYYPCQSDSIGAPNHAFTTHQ